MYGAHTEGEEPIALYKLRAEHLKQRGFLQVPISILHIWHCTGRTDRELQLPRYQRELSSRSDHFVFYPMPQLEHDHIEHGGVSHATAGG